MVSVDDERLDDDVISPETIWRFVRSMVDPVFRPVRYFELVQSEPRRYLKPKQALGVLFIVVWVTDQALTNQLRGIGVPPPRLGNSVVMLALRGILSGLVVWGVPFFARIGATAARFQLTWRNATLLAASQVPWSLLETPLQAMGPYFRAVAMVMALAVMTNASVRLCQTTVRRALVATLVSTLVWGVAFTVLNLIFGVALNTELSLGEGPVG